MKYFFAFRGFDSTKKTLKMSPAGFDLIRFKFQDSLVKFCLCLNILDVVLILASTWRPVNFQIRRSKWKLSHFQRASVTHQVFVFFTVVLSRLLLSRWRSALLTESKWTLTQKTASIPTTDRADSWRTTINAACLCERVLVSLYEANIKQIIQMKIELNQKVVVF